MDAKAGTLARDEVSVESQWDLTGLYSFDEVWSAELTELEVEVEKYASFSGTLGESALNLKACLEFDMNFSRQLEKLYTFAHLKNDEDKTNSLYQGNFEKVMMLVN
ncbi:MAG: oligoendopeptidase F family protein, partial [Nitrospinae bacterium]|nr:oligoendopeptidase F family protein [Nitrospinota bacterium]